TYLGEGLEVTQLDSGGLGFQNFGGIGQFLRGFEFAFGMNNLGAAFAFGFGLAGDGTLHLLGDVDLLHFDFADFDAPGFGVGVEDDLELGVYFVALREDFVQLELADDAADGGLRELRDGVSVVLHLRESHVGVDYAEITYGVYFNADVVASDDVL